MVEDLPVSESLLLLLTRYYLLQGENWIFLSFGVSHPHSREDRRSPRKRVLCEVWVPEMSITSLEVPRRGKASESRGADGRSPTCNHVIAGKCAASHADPARHPPDAPIHACTSCRRTSVSTFVEEDEGFLLPRTFFFF